MPRKSLHAFTINLIKLFFCRKKIFVCRDFDNCLCSCSKKKLVVNCMNMHILFQYHKSCSVNVAIKCKSSLLAKLKDMLSIVKAMRGIEKLLYFLARMIPTYLVTCEITGFFHHSV